MRMEDAPGSSHAIPLGPTPSPDPSAVAGLPQVPTGGPKMTEREALDYICKMAGMHSSSKVRKEGEESRPLDLRTMRRRLENCPEDLKNATIEPTA